MTSTSFLSKHKIASLLIVVFLFFPTCSVFCAEKSQKSVNEKILEILIDKNIITKEQYEELKMQAQKEESAKTPKAVAGFNKGFYIETTDKQHKIKFDGRFHGDFKAYLGDHPDHSSFFIRRARLCASGTVYKYYSSFAPLRWVCGL